MKKIILNLIALLCIFYGNAQKTDNEYKEEWEEDVVETKHIEDKTFVHWENSFKEAIVKSKLEKKPILIYFTGSDWCGPCKRLDEKLFHTEKFVSYSKEKMVLYMADFPRNTDLVSEINRSSNKQLSRKYNQESFPTIIIVDENGGVLGRKNGSYIIEYYFPFFESITNSYN